MFKVASLVLALGALAVSSCFAQPSADVSTNYKVAAISAWVLHGPSKARAEPLSADVARLLGLSKASLNSTAANYANNENGLALWFATFPGRSDVVLVRIDRKIERVTYWRVKDGVLAATAQRQDGKLELVSGEVYDKGAMAILDYFYDHLPASQAK